MGATQAFPGPAVPWYRSCMSRRVWLLALSVGSAAGLLWTAVPVKAADPVKVGPELLVSDGPDDDYVYTPRVAVDPAGNFVVAWQDTYYYSEIRARAFWSTGNPRGPKFVMSEPHLYVSSGNFDDDELLSIAADGAGNFLVAYNAETYSGSEPACDDNPCIVTKRFESTGVLSSASFIVGDPRLFPYEEEHNQTANPELAADGEGNFVVAWEGYDKSDVSGYVEDEGVWARKLVSVGQVNGSQFRVNGITEGYQGDTGYLDIAADDVGNFVAVWEDDNYDVAPYGGVVFQRFDKNKNLLGPQTLVTPPSPEDPHVAQLPDGTFMVIWNDAGSIGGRVFDPSGAAVGPEFAVASGGYPEIAASRAGSFIVVFESSGPGSNAAGRMFDATGTPTSSEFQLNTASSAFTPDVDADDDGNFVVTWNAGDGYAYAQRFQATTPTTQEIPVLGKVAVITNKNPDDFFKSTGKWKASAPEVVSPLRGSASDPRCNGDPEGTVKATVRFVSTTSGQDHTIDLPCQNWTATGGNKVNSVSKRGYKYSDGKREDGPCNSVKIKGTKSVSITCKGKPGAASFDYDLQSGQSQGVLTTVLQMGLFEYCAEFQPFFDGSDGKKYKGKALAAPASCP